ncbi:MAG: sortase [Actinomycetota bacterium]
MRATRRLIIVLVAGLTFSMLGAAVIKRQEKFDENTMLASATPSSTTTTIAPSTTTTPVVAVTRPSRPVAAPREAYAPEPIVEIGRIEIPKIGLDHKIMHGISMRNIDEGPSHWPGTALPGEPGNTVFAGHRVTHTHPFRNLDQLVADDLVIFHVNGLKSIYKVTGLEIVYPDNLGIVNQTENATGTLFACHPPHSAKQRIVAHLLWVENVLES